MIQSHRFLCRWRLWPAAALVCAAASTAAAQSEAPTASGPKHRWYDPRRYVDRFRETAEEVARLEVVEQLGTLATGRGPDGSGGWFHDGQSRYGWEWLADRYDWDGDGVVLRDDLPRLAADLGARLDRDQDGKITKDDFDWSNNSTYMKQVAQTKRFFGPVDRDRNGHITKEEWTSFLDRAALDADSITPDDLQAALFPYIPPSPNDGPTPLNFVRGVVSG